MEACQQEMLAACQVHSATSLGLVEVEFPLTWFMTTAFLSKPVDVGHIKVNNEWKSLIFNLFKLNFRVIFLHKTAHLVMF